MSSHISQYRDCWSLTLNTDPDLEREDDEPSNDDLVTREIAEETTAASLYQRIVDTIKLDKKTSGRPTDKCSSSEADRVFTNTFLRQLLRRCGGFRFDWKARCAKSSATSDAAMPK